MAANSARRSAAPSLVNGSGAGSTPRTSLPNVRAKISSSGFAAGDDVPAAGNEVADAAHAAAAVNQEPDSHGRILPVGIGHRLRRTVFENGECVRGQIHDVAAAATFHHDLQYHELGL